jgi:regulator of PEP synthase PpsR (kinase-PPPase family)
MRPERLRAYREQRLKVEGIEPDGHNGDYTNPRKIAEELVLVEQFIAAHPGCHVIDVTSMGSEEAAAMVLKAMRRKRNGIRH